MATGVVPNVVGLTEAEAYDTIDSYGFVASRSTSTIGANSGNNGTVKSQSPSAGVSRTLGTTVSFVVYSYTAPTTTTAPNVVGLDWEIAESVVISNSLAPQAEASSSGATASNDRTVFAQAYSAGSSRPINSLFPYSYYQFNNWLGLGISAARGVLDPNTIQVSWSAYNQLTTDATFTVTSSPASFTFPKTYTLASNASNSWWTPSFYADPYTTYTFTISGTGKYGTESNSVTLYGATPPVIAPSWSDNTLGEFRVGEVYADSVVASGTSPTYTVSAGSLPAGITMSGGALSGTPTTKGAYSFTITASNSAGSVSASFSGTVGPPKGGVYVYDGTEWKDASVKTLDGSGGSAAAEVYYTLDGTNWIKSF